MKIEKESVNDNIKKRLIIGIMIVSLLLVGCIAVDSADDTITNVNNNSSLTNIPKNTVVINNSHVSSKNVGMAVSDGKVYIDTTVKVKPKYTNKTVKVKPKISMYAKPSCGCRHKYTWHYREFVNYCPNCHHYGTLRKNPKGVPEREYTCSRCSSDFCGVCGKEKYSWSRVYLSQ